MDFNHVLEHINKMSPEEFRESLRRAGIITKSGKLTAKYRRKEPMSIKYLKGDATCPQAKGKKIICHVCNNV